MASGRGHRACLDPLTLVPLLMALQLDQPLLLPQPPDGSALKNTHNLLLKLDFPIQLIPTSQL